MANVKVFADKQTDKWTGLKLDAPDLWMWGHKKEIMLVNSFPTIFHKLKTSFSRSLKVGIVW